MALTPTEEAKYALNYGVSRSDLSLGAQIEYDRLVAEGYEPAKTAPVTGTKRTLTPAEIDRVRALYEKTARALEDMQERVAALDPTDGLYPRLVQERDKLVSAKEQLAQVLLTGRGFPQPATGMVGAVPAQQTVYVQKRNGVWTFVGVLVAFLLILFIIGLFVEAHKQSQLQPGQPYACPSGYVWNSVLQQCELG